MKLHTYVDLKGYVDMHSLYCRQLIGDLRNRGFKILNSCYQIDPEDIFTLTLLGFVITTNNYTDTGGNWTRI